MTIFYFVFKRFFRKFSDVLFLCLLPIASVFLPAGEWLPIPLGFQYYGIILLFVAAKLASILMEDRTNKTLLRIGVSPITHFQYLWQNLLAYSLILMGLNLVFIIAGVILHGEALISPILLFIIYAFFSMTAIGFSLAWYALFRSKEAAFSVLTGVIVLMSMLGGIMWPVEIMPIPLQRGALLLPTYWFAEGIVLISFGASILELVLPLVMMFMFSIVFLLLGSRRKIA
ncbi:ABC transporter permease [Clostridium formicaceticum]|uniref:ABC-2 family transporter protein n=1 Tax=Clostridium formicaceticum TaxID=1497 RepID=A0AAC9WH87_9CLOT|nr:ABC transporter permease [Clostridium formicaceticum]AOY78057.1 multidrug ABC transporter permease [Clostridium formicaceticum]ARE88693.1 ABC-2 family transporter protein [Clostridium formicaceticum]